MARRRFSDIHISKEEHFDFASEDVADQAFWDEFWTQEADSQEDAPLVTVTIRNQETGEEQVIEDVRLCFRNLKKLRA